MVLETFWLTEIEKVESYGSKTAPIVILRDPIDRFVSNLHYAKKRIYTSHWKIRNQTLSEYLTDPESMLQSLKIWFDGSVSWMIHFNYFVHSVIVLYLFPSLEDNTSSGFERSVFLIYIPCYICRTVKHKQNRIIMWKFIILWLTAIFKICFVWESHQRL